MVAKRQKVCEKCETLQYLWARKMCKNCDRKENPHKHGMQPKLIQNVIINPNDDITRNDIMNYPTSYIELEKAKTPLRTAKKGLKKSHKGKMTSAELEKYNEIAANKPQYCAGCGRNDGKIHRSHRIPQGHRPDLKLVADNIDLMCLDCHTKVENWDLDTLNNRQEIFDYVKLNDTAYFKRKVAQNVRNKFIRRNENK